MSGKKILIVSVDLNGPGGVTHYYRAVLPHLSYDEFDYFVIGTRYKGKKLPFIIRMLLDYFSFALKAPAYELIHFNPSLGAKCFFREMPLILYAKLCRKKVIVFFRGWTVSFEKRIDKFFRGLFARTFGLADAMIVLASDFTRALHRWGYTGQIYEETTTVDEHLLSGIDLDTKRILKDGVCNVLFLARIEREKGIFEAIQSIELIPEDQDKITFQLTVGGDGGAREEIVNYLDENRSASISYQGYLRGDEKIDALRNANIFIFPSYHGEGMPNSVLEAMAFGLPIITCATGGISDFFEDGEMGYLVEPQNAGQISEALQKLVEHPEKLNKSGQFNCRYAKKYFYSSRVAERLNRIYGNILSGEMCDGSVVTIQN